MTHKKMTILALQDKKARGEPITMITAYDYPGALAADRAGLDCDPGRRFAGNGRAGLRFHRAGDDG